MLPALPEVLFHDIEKEKQVYEEPVKPLFKINFIQRFFNTKLDKYTKDYYSKVYKLFFETFKKEFETINAFILYRPPKPKEEETIFILDDEDELDEESAKALAEALEEDEDDEFDLSDALGWLGKIRKAWKKIKNAWRAFKRIKNILKGKWNKFWKIARNAWKKAKKFSSKAWTKGKSFLNAAKSRFLNWYRNTFKRYIGQMKGKIMKWGRKIKRLLRPVVKRIARIVKVFFKKTLKKFGKKTLMKFLRVAFKKALQFIVSSIIKLVAGAFTATGVGAFIGAALFYASLAWDAYELTNDVGDFMSTDELEQKGYKPEGDDVKVESAPPPLHVANVKITDISKEEVISMYNETEDKVTTALINSKSQPLQIIGRFYEFYKTSDRWLQHEQEFLVSFMTEYTKQWNDYFTKLVNFTESKYDVSEFDKKPMGKKDPTKVKKPEFKSMKDIMVIQDQIVKGEDAGALSRWYRGVTVNKKFSESKVDPRDIEAKKKGRKLIASILGGKLKFINIETVDPHVKIVKLDTSMKPVADIRKEKIGLMGVKNHLLYQLYCRFAWMRECSDFKV